MKIGDHENILFCILDTTCAVIDIGLGPAASWKKCNLPLHLHCENKGTILLTATLTLRDSIRNIKYVNFPATIRPLPHKDDILLSVPINQQLRKSNDDYYDKPGREDEMDDNHFEIPNHRSKVR